MEERYKLAILHLPENRYYQWVKFISDSYRKEHIEDNPIELLHITLFHTHPNGMLNPNKRKLQKLEDIITDLFLTTSKDLIDQFEEASLSLEYKLDLAKKGRKKGAEAFYYRFVLRTLINHHKFAREVLKLDRDEELEAVHHLYRLKNSNPQINFELGVWKSLEEKHAEADYHFTELYKTLPNNYVPAGDIRKICTLTLDKLKGYLGISHEKMETEQDESYARELFHYSKELDGKRRVHRDMSEIQEPADLDLLSHNLDLIKLKIVQDGLGDQFLRAKKIMKIGIRESKNLCGTSRKIFEDILSRVGENDLHFWADCIYGLSVITCFEEPVADIFYDTLIEINNIFGYPTIKEWTPLLGLSMKHSGFKQFLDKFLKDQHHIPDELVNLAYFMQKVIRLNEASEPYNSEFLADVYLDFLDWIEKCELKTLQKLIEYIQVAPICKKLSRWLFTAVRVLKYIHKERQTEADQLYTVIPNQYNDLIIFEHEFIIDIPTDIDYKIKTGVHDYSKLVKLTKSSIDRTKRLAPGAFNDYFLGNLYLLEEKFGLALKEYLHASRVIESPKFYKRLVYSIMKVEALFEGLILYQLSDPDYSLSKCKVIFNSCPLQKFFFKYIVDIDMLEYIIEQNKGREEVVKTLLELVDSPERHQSGNIARVKKIYLEKLLDLLHFSVQYSRRIS